MATEAPSSDPPQSDKIDSRGVPVLLRWDQSGQPRCIGASISTTPVFLDIDLDTSTKTASLRLRVNLYRRHSDQPTPVYLIIGPGELQSITQSEPPPEIEEEVALKTETGTTSLLLRLRRHATFVVPPEPMRLNDKRQAAVLKMIRLAAQQSALFLLLPPDALPPAQLAAICDASLASFEGSSRHADLGSLYGGRGGKILELSNADAAQLDSPPSYDELEAPPPVAPTTSDSVPTSSSKKRRRSSSPARDSDNYSSVESLLKKVLVEHQATTHEMLRTEMSRLESRILERIDQRLDDRACNLEETLRAQVDELREQIKTLRRNVRQLAEAGQAEAKWLEEQVRVCQEDTGKLDDECQVALDRLECQIAAVSDDIDLRIEAQVEDKVLGLKIEVEDYVKDELRDTEETLRARFAEGSWSLQFNE